ncbi:uncharacterized protein TRIADDRAFT_51752 [Trichoplax adhaerens]|uniref:AB hydrolase-1 domain-containing protein n=1 Tax=Trichoplax adhaerens TaxID=10228 RepID=B3RKT0_TRIAD|nr:hypothetical protein TRIADDRAFT_51752 [Trichoplax adhaerens]EDV28636.1 hypothetical protein TRIADDRAFT_51752 [Trichoplax adhaerens]|eukprot:XP_002107838.1 hypothetical protein TRIADDRAFT_51752 [Trichoplax adhaerens]
MHIARLWKRLRVPASVRDGYSHLQHGLIRKASPIHQCVRHISIDACRWNPEDRRGQIDLPTPIDPEVQYVNVQTKNLGVTSVDYIKASYTDENPTGSAIAIAVHGSPGSHYDFRYMAPLLSEAGVRVIRINLPGFGPTIKPPDFIYSPVNKANFMAELLESIGIKKVDIAIGHSMGCGAITSFPSTHPGFVSSYALLASCGTRPHRSLRPFPIIKLFANMVNLPVIDKPSGALLRLVYIKNEIENSQRLCGAMDFDFNAKNLKLLGDQKTPVILGFGLNDHMVEHAIFDEMSSVLGLRTLSEMLALTNDQGNENPHLAYDVATGKSRQLVFRSSGHYIQKFHARHIAKAILHLLHDL